MAGREGYKRSVRFNINILTIIRVNNLGFDHLIYKRFPKICYINFIAHVKLIKCQDLMYKKYYIKMYN